MQHHEAHAQHVRFRVGLGLVGVLGFLFILIETLMAGGVKVSHATETHTHTPYK